MARRGRLGPWYVLGIALIKPFSAALWRRESSRREHLPATGGVILAANHISLADPAVLAVRGEPAPAMRHDPRAALPAGDRRRTA